MNRVELFERLIAFDSTSHRSNLDLAAFVGDVLVEAGFRVELPANTPGDKTNVLARTGPEDGEGLLLSGHLDTVPALEPAWESDPFSLTDRGDRWAARGTADMKGFVALALEAAGALRGARLRHGLVLLFTYDEEVGTVGAQDFVDGWDRRFPLPRNAVIGEPTAMRVVRAHKGHLRFRLVTRGVSAHSGYPDLGVNAIERAGRAVAAIGNLNRRLRREGGEGIELFPAYPFASINTAQVSGGTAINIVPDACTLDLGVRTLPGFTAGGFAARLREVLRDGAGLDDGDYTLETVNESPPLLTSADASVHRALCELVDQQESLGVSYASDAGPFARLGLDCVLFGPGSIEVAHKPNEFIPKAEFHRAAEILDALIARFCRG